MIKFLALQPLPFLGLALAACSQQSDQEVAAAPTPSVLSSNGVNQAYVDTALNASAVDLAACRRSPGMEGIAGASDMGEVIVAVDSSGSMAGRAGTGTKMDEARVAATQFVGSFPANTRVGVLAFGDVGDNRIANKGASCAADPHFLFGPASLDPQAVQRSLTTLRPAGWTPLAAAIRSAAVRFTAPDQTKRTLFVISDGIETCGGDPVSAARDAHASARVVVNVIGYGVGAPAEVAALKRVAEAGGGSYRDAAPGQLLATLRGQAVRAERNNSISVVRAMQSMEQCYLAGIAKQRDALMTRIDADKAAGRINQATYSTLTDASMKRFQTGYDDFVHTHEANMSRENAARADISSSIANSAAGN